MIRTDVTLNVTFAQVLEIFFPIGQGDIRKRISEGAHSERLRAIAWPEAVLRRRAASSTTGRLRSGQHQPQAMPGAEHGCKGGRPCRRRPLRPPWGTEVLPLTVRQRPAEHPSIRVLLQRSRQLSRRSGAHAGIEPAVTAGRTVTPSPPPDLVIHSTPVHHVMPCLRAVPRWPLREALQPQCGEAPQRPG